MINLNAIKSLIRLLSAYFVFIAHHHSKLQSYDLEINRKYYVTSMNI